MAAKRRDRTSVSARARGVTALALGAGLAACAGAGSIDTDPKADVFILSNRYETLANKGKGPVELSKDEVLSRYMFSRKGLDPEYLLVLYPEKATSAIRIKLSDTGAPRSVQADEGRYFDRLLRAHRLLLKGRIDEAKETIRVLDAEYDPSYGTLVLLGNVYVVEGKMEEALRIFENASSLMPENEDIKRTIARLKAEGAG